MTTAEFQAAKAAILAIILADVNTLVPSFFRGNIPDSELEKIAEQTAAAGLLAAEKIRTMTGREQRHE